MECSIIKLYFILVNISMKPKAGEENKKVKDPVSV